MAQLGYQALKTDDVQWETEIQDDSCHPEREKAEPQEHPASAKGTP